MTTATTRAMTRLSLLAGTVLATLPAWTFAEPPAALDRVPTDAIVTIGIKSIESFDARVGKLLDDLKIDQQGEVGIARKMMKTPGLNAKGSAAVAIFDKPKHEKPAGDKAADAPADADEDAGDQPPMVIVLPVSDYAAFVKHFGTADPKGVVELTPPADDVDGSFEGPMFAKDLGGGYAALSPEKAVVEKFDGKPGHMPAHAKALGKVGTRITDTAETIVVANIPLLGPKIKDGFAEGMSSYAQMAAMGGGPGAAQAEKAQAIGKAVVEAFVRDAQIGIVGLGLDDAGVWFDFGAQFKEGSETFKTFQGNGTAAALTGKLPDQPYLFAFSMDTSQPGIKQIFKNAAELTKPKPGEEENDPMGIMANLTKQIDDINGYSMIMGQSAGGIMGGLLSNSAMYISSSKPANYAAFMKDMSAKMNGKTAQGVTYQTTYDAAALDINGVKVDKYSSMMQVDPNSDQAQAMQQAQMMMFGPNGGASGYVAQVDKGVVVTLAPSKTLMGAALDAAKGTKAIADNKDAKDVGGKLPANRTLEMFIGVKSILDQVAMFMPGGKPTPASLPPLGIGGTTNEGGAHVRVFAPTAVITALKDRFANEGDQGADEAPAEDKGKPPRF